MGTDNQNSQEDATQEVRTFTQEDKYDPPNLEGRSTQSVLTHWMLRDL